METRKTELTKKLTLEALKKFRGCFNQKPSDEDLETYAELLSAKFEFKQVTWAMTQFVENGSTFFPSCGELFSMLKPAEQKKEDKAPLIANEIIQFIRLHSFDLEHNYLHTLSPDALAVVYANGGTRSIRDSENFETMKAQLERLAKGVIANRDAENKNESLQRIGIDVAGKVLPMKKPELRTMDFSGYLPTEGA